MVRNTCVNQQLIIVVKNTYVNQQSESCKNYLCKLTINDSGLVGKEIHVYIKFTHTTKLNNVWIGT